MASRPDPVPTYSSQNDDNELAKLDWLVRHQYASVEEEARRASAAVVLGEVEPRGKARAGRKETVKLQRQEVRPASAYV